MAPTFLHMTTTGDSMAASHNAYRISAALLLLSATNSKRTTEKERSSDQSRCSTDEKDKELQKKEAGGDKNESTCKQATKKRKRPFTVADPYLNLSRRLGKQYGAATCRSTLSNATSGTSNQNLARLSEKEQEDEKKDGLEHWKELHAGNDAENEKAIASPSRDASKEDSNRSAVESQMFHFVQRQMGKCSATSSEQQQQESQTPQERKPDFVCTSCGLLWIPGVAGTTVRVVRRQNKRSGRCRGAQHTVRYRCGACSFVQVYPGSMTRDKRKGLREQERAKRLQRRQDAARQERYARQRQAKRQAKGNNDEANRHPSPPSLFQPQQLPPPTPPKLFLSSSSSLGDFVSLSSTTTPTKPTATTPLTTSMGMRRIDTGPKKKKKKPLQKKESKLMNFLSSLNG